MNRDDWLRLVKLAEADIREAGGPTVGSDKCAACGRRIRTIYRVGDLPYGEKCALRARRTIVNEGVFQ